VTIVIKYLHPEAKSRGFPATRAPKERAPSALESVRLNTVTGCPARAKWPAMGMPMIPKPMKPTDASDSLMV
jgi:hypothetical protein